MGLLPLPILPLPTLYILLSVYCLCRFCRCRLCLFSFLFFLSPFSCLCRFCQFCQVSSIFTASAESADDDYSLSILFLFSFYSLSPATADFADADFVYYYLSF